MSQNSVSIIRSKLQGKGLLSETVMQVFRWRFCKLFLLFGNNLLFVTLATN
jgi:hypothetical protein